MRRYGVIGVAIGIVLSCVGVASVRAASLNDFVISEYRVATELKKDEDDRSTLTTQETITANFTHRERNRGIERAVPTKYLGHSLNLDVQSVTDESRRSLPYTTYSNGDDEVVRVGEEDTFVHGEHTYVITYAQRDVTRFFESTDKDEFHWNLLGTQWRVPIQQFTATVKVSPDLLERYDQSSCYQGEQGSTQECVIERPSDGLFSVQASNLAAGEGLTVALGFQPDTFAPYEPTLMERLVPIWQGLLILTTFGAVIMIIAGVWRYGAKHNRKKELGTVVPEYTAPRDASVTVAGEVIDAPQSVFVAQLLDFAVRHYIKIHETKSKSLWSAAEYSVEVVRDITSLREEEQEILRDMFAKVPQVGDTLKLKDLSNSTKFTTRLGDNPKKLKKLTRGEYDLRARQPAETKWFYGAARIALVVAVVTLSPSLLFAALMLWVLGYTLWPLTDRGLVLRRYLKGLKLYISVAEEERLKMLQSPEGAEKVGVIGGGETEKLITLYEKVLPYAVLFGQEKDWGKALGRYYEATQSSPDWYDSGGRTVFNAAVLTSAISNFSTSASSANATSSSSGGSSGGGFSGGGGGGGGGGGW